jgi:hypothetical protein
VTYGERWNDIRISADTVGETPDYHVVEVDVHNRNTEMIVRLLVKKAFYYGTMIGWIAVRVVLADLAAGSLERIRRLESGRLVGDVLPENRKEYLEAMGQAPGLGSQAHFLPNRALRPHMFSVLENGSPENSLHNARKLIFDDGLPIEVQFYQGEEGNREVMAYWTSSNHVFTGFDWKTPEGRSALGDFLGALNPWHPIDVPAMHPQRLFRRKGPKEWSPGKPATLVLGFDYGEEFRKESESPEMSGRWEPGPKDWMPEGARLKPENVKRVVTVWLDANDLLGFGGTSTTVYTNAEWKELGFSEGKTALVSLILGTPLFDIMNYNAGPEEFHAFEDFLDGLGLWYEMSYPTMLHIYKQPSHWK